MLVVIIFYNELFENDILFEIKNIFILLKNVKYAHSTDYWISKFHIYPKC